jgi:hypothetical protein
MIRGEDFLRLADAWAQGANEAIWRSAVSRAYCGGFHVARDFLASLGFRVPRADQAHAYLWRRLMNCQDTQVEKVGSTLNQLRGDRNWADYRIERDLLQAESRLKIQLARASAGVLTSISDTARLDAITAAIRDYERDILREETWQAP